MTTIGYGDIYPRNSVERLVAILIMLVCSSVFAYFLTGISNFVY